MWVWVPPSPSCCSDGPPPFGLPGGTYDTSTVRHARQLKRSRVDAATHRIKPDMPIYILFRRVSRQHTQLWYEPLEEENVGHSTAHEVTGDAYRNVAKAAQRRASVLRVRDKDGEFQATFVRGVVGRAPSERHSALTSKLMHEHLATDARVAMWGGMERGAVACGCGRSLRWVDREDIGPLQWHFLECELAPERAIRRRWRAAVKTALTAATDSLLPNAQPLAVATLMPNAQHIVNVRRHICL